MEEEVSTKSVRYRNKHDKRMVILHSYPWFETCILLNEKNQVILTGIPIKQIKESKSWQKES